MCFFYFLPRALLVKCLYDFSKTKFSLTYNIVTLVWFFLLSTPRIYNFSDFFVCTTPHPSTIQRTGVFSKWLFSTNKFLYVNTTQNVYEHVKKINFVACGLLAGDPFFQNEHAIPHRIAVHRSIPGTSGGIDLWTRSLALRRRSPPLFRKRSIILPCMFVSSLCARLQTTQLCEPRI